MSGGQWIAVDAYFPGTTLYERLLGDLGPAGPLAWINLIAWAKRTNRDGLVKYVNTVDALENLGLTGADLGRPVEVWLEDFWRLLAKLKQASRDYRRSGAGTARKVRVTNYGAWQKDRVRTAGAASDPRGTAAGPPRKGSSEGLNDAHEKHPDTTFDLRPSTFDLDSLPPPASSTGVTGQAPPDPAEQRRRRDQKLNGNGHGNGRVEQAARLIAEHRLAEARTDIAAGRRPPIHAETAWLTAATTDVLVHHGDELAGLDYPDPGELATAWERTHQPTASGPVGPPTIVRCATCGDLTHDCICRPG